MKCILMITFLLCLTSGLAQGVRDNGFSQHPDEFTGEWGCLHRLFLSRSEGDQGINFIKNKDGTFTVMIRNDGLKYDQLALVEPHLRKENYRIFFRFADGTTLNYPPDETFTFSGEDDDGTFHQTFSLEMSVELYTKLVNADSPVRYRIEGENTFEDELIPALVNPAQGFYEKCFL